MDHTGVFLSMQVTGIHILAASYYAQSLLCGEDNGSRGIMGPYMTRLFCLGSGYAQAGGSWVAGRCCGSLGTPACVVACTCREPSGEDAGNRECHAPLP